jgi:hypothetical protein
MHGVRPAVKCPAPWIGTPQQTIWIPRGGSSKGSGSGPSGYKLKPARILARALAEQARNVRARKK